MPPSGSWHVRADGQDTRRGLASSPALTLGLDRPGILLGRGPWGGWWPAGHGVAGLPTELVQMALGQPAPSSMPGIFPTVCSVGLPQTSPCCSRSLANSADALCCLSLALAAQLAGAGAACRLRGSQLLGPRDGACALPPSPLRASPTVTLSLLSCCSQCKIQMMSMLEKPGKDCGRQGFRMGACLGVSLLPWTLPLLALRLNQPPCWQAPGLAFAICRPLCCL